MTMARSTSRSFFCMYKIKVCRVKLMRLSSSSIVNTIVMQVRATAGVDPGGLHVGACGDRARAAQARVGAERAARRAARRLHHARARSSPLGGAAHRHAAQGTVSLSYFFLFYFNLSRTRFCCIYVYLRTDCSRRNI
jgi:hypothetical protein